MCTYAVIEDCGSVGLYAVNVLYPKHPFVLASISVCLCVCVCVGVYVSVCMCVLSMALKSVNYCVEDTDIVGSQKYVLSFYLTKIYAVYEIRLVPFLYICHIRLSKRVPHVTNEAHVGGLAFLFLKGWVCSAVR